MFIQIPLPEEVVHVFSMQHWMLAAPGQYPATWKPPVVQEEVDMQVPEPSGVVQVVRSNRLEGFGVAVERERRERRRMTTVKEEIEAMIDE